MESKRSVNSQKAKTLINLGSLSQVSSVPITEYRRSVLREENQVTINGVLVIVVVVCHIGLKSEKSAMYLFFVKSISRKIS